MNKIFSSLPLPSIPCREYNCSDNTFMLLYTDVDKDIFDSLCSALECKGFELYDSSIIEGSTHRFLLVARK